MTARKARKSIKPAVQVITRCPSLLPVHSGTRIDYALNYLKIDWIRQFNKLCMIEVAWFYSNDIFFYCSNDVTYKDTKWHLPYSACKYRNIISSKTRNTYNKPYMNQSNWAKTFLIRETVKFCWWYFKVVINVTFHYNWEIRPEWYWKNRY